MTECTGRDGGSGPTLDPKYGSCCERYSHGYAAVMAKLPNGRGLCDSAPVQARRLLRSLIAAGPPLGLTGVGRTE